MNLEQFNNSLIENDPPNSVSDYLKALWYDGKGNWQKSHEIIQDIEDKSAAWIHAYLHRKEGDIWNADYWYNRAGRKRPSVSLQEEWKDIVQAML